MVGAKLRKEIGEWMHLLILQLKATKVDDEFENDMNKNNHLDKSHIWDLRAQFVLWSEKYNSCSSKHYLN